MLWMLQQVVKGGTGYGAVPPNRPAAGKTGTSEGGRDLWFIGGVPQIVTGLWLGYDNNKETKSTSAVAVVAWADYMGPILKDLPVRQFPPKPQLAGKFDPLKALKGKPKAIEPAGTPGASTTPGTAPQVIPEGTPTEASSAEPAIAPAGATPAAPPPVDAGPTPPPPVAPATPPPLP